MEIIACDHGADAEAAQQDLGDECLRREARQGFVEGDDDHAINAEPLQDPGLGVARREAEDRVGSFEKIGGMRLEGEDNAGKAKFFSQGVGAFDHGHMAAMHAIEIADRGDRAVEPRRRRGRINGDDEFFGGGKDRPREPEIPERSRKRKSRACS